MDPSFDMFSQSVNTSAFSDDVDTYDYFDKTAAAPPVSREPAYTIDLGIDHKTALLNKAFSTGFYREVKTGDASKNLPIGDKRFATIFSNILYWLDDYPNCLRMMHAALNDGGKLVLCVPSDTFRNYSFYQRLYVQTGDPRWQWLQRLDAGRSDSVKHCHDLDGWAAIFNRCGFIVSEYRR